MGLADRATAPSDRELRSYTAQFEVRAVPGNPSKIELEGYASVFNVPYPVTDMLGTYTETVRAGAFSRTLSQRPDVAYLANHEGLMMASTSSGSLRLSQDSRGLLTLAQVNTGRGDVRDLVTAVEDGDINQMSFVFRVFPGDGQEWSADQRTSRRASRTVDLAAQPPSPARFMSSPSRG